MADTVNIPNPRQARLADYLAIARFDHATKHVFIVPGLILAWALLRPQLDGLGWKVVAGFVAAVAIASANYVINEWLDREFDALHPSKHKRTAVACDLSPTLVYCEWALFGAAGLTLAASIGQTFFYTAIAFLLQGIVYNVRPLRSKDKPFLDVVSESVNNPIRLTLGWTMVAPDSLPPVSLLLAYWTGGAFLMGAKRLSEYRDFAASGGIATLSSYRKSFAGYTSESLTVSVFIYAMMASFFIGIFLVKYRLEYVLGFPFIAALFGCYLWLSMLPDSIAQRPERSFRSKRLMLSLILAVGSLVILSFVDIPVLSSITERSFTPAGMHRDAGAP